MTSVAGVEISHPDKVLFPDDGITKLDLAQYYADVAPVMLRHVRGRPVNMERFPNGIGEKGFYEKKRPSHFPSWFSSVTVRTSEGTQEQVVADDARSLVYLAQQACISPHTWLSRAASLSNPVELVVDLDPTVEDLAAVRRGVRLVRALLEDLGLTPFLKATGSRGYHVVVPLRPAASYDEVRGLAVDLAQLLVARHPDLFTLEHRKASRGDRVYLDIWRNGYGQTAVPPYAVRPKPGCPVAVPLEWDELSRVAPDHADMTSVRRRLARRGDPWKDIRRRAQGLTEARTRLARLTAG